ncbi:MAG: response regulator transcription factor [Chloroflexota bacterium]
MAEVTAAEFRPDATLVDLSGDRPDLEDILAALQVISPVAALVHTTNDGQLAEAARAGVQSYALYSSRSDELLLALRSAAASEPYLPAAVATRILVTTARGDMDGLSAGATVDSSSDTSPLTPPERRVLGLMIEGFSNRAIASELRTSERTVARRLRCLYTKLNAVDRVTAVKNAVIEGVR